MASERAQSPAWPRHTSRGCRRSDRAVSTPSRGAGAGAFGRGTACAGLRSLAVARARASGHRRRAPIAVVAVLERLGRRPGGHQLLPRLRDPLIRRTVGPGDPRPAPDQARTGLVPVGFSVPDAHRPWTTGTLPTGTRGDATVPRRQMRVAHRRLGQAA